MMRHFFIIVVALCVILHVNASAQNAHHTWIDGLTLGDVSFSYVGIDSQRIGIILEKKKVKTFPINPAFRSIVDVPVPVYMKGHLAGILPVQFNDPTDQIWYGSFPGGARLRKLDGSFESFSFTFEGNVSEVLQTEDQRIIFATNIWSEEGGEYEDDLGTTWCKGNLLIYDPVSNTVIDTFYVPGEILDIDVTNTHLAVAFSGKAHYDRRTEFAEMFRLTDGGTISNLLPFWVGLPLYPRCIAFVGDSSFVLNHAYSGITGDLPAGNNPIAFWNGEHWDIRAQTYQSRLFNSIRLGSTPKHLAFSGGHVKGIVGVNDCENIETVQCSELYTMDLETDSIEDWTLYSGYGGDYDDTIRGVLWLPGDTSLFIWGYVNELENRETSFVYKVKGGAIVYRQEAIQPPQVTGFTPVESVGEIKIYPNPANDMIWIDGLAEFPARESTISIFDALGRLVVTQQIDGSGPVSVDIRSLLSGVYLAKIEIEAVQGRIFKTQRISVFR